MSARWFIRGNIFLLTFLSVLLCFNDLSGAVVLNDSISDDKENQSIKERATNQLRGNNESGPEYVPGKIIVKFKENTGIGQEGSLIKASVDVILPNLNVKVKGIERLFKDKTPKKEIIQEKLQVLQAKKEPKTNVQLLEEKRLKRLEKAQELTLKHGLDRIYVIELKDKDQDILPVIENLKKNPNIEYAEPDYIMEIQMVPNDPYYNSRGSWGQPYDDLWGIKKIHCEDAWDISQGEGVVVAVIDTGVDYNHEELVGNIWVNEAELNGQEGVDDDNNGYIDDIRGWDFVNNDNNPMDDKGHGSHCSGTIAAVGNNTTGVIGVAPKAKIMAVKGLSASGGGNTENLARCVRYAADNGADILSSSWGGLGTNQTLLNAFHYANDLGCVSIAAAGNDNMDVSSSTPANIDTVVAVAASNQNDERCSFSNYGLKIDVAAPGGDSAGGDGGNRWGRNILSLRSDNNGHPTDSYGDSICIVGDKYYRSRGTSMACPHVAGLAAVIKSMYPADSPIETRARIIAGADNIDNLNPDFKGLLGRGRINLYNSLTVAPRPIFRIAAIERSNIYPGIAGSIIIHLKNFWQNAEGVVATLLTDDPLVTIQNNNISFGDILTGETKTNSDNPFMISLDAQIPFGEVINFSLTLNCQDGYEETLNFIITVSYFEDVKNEVNLPFNNLLPLSIAMCDYNNDDFTDLYYIGSDMGWTTEGLYKNNKDGSFVCSNSETGVDVEGYAFTSLFIDIDNDGNEDLFVGSAAGSHLFLNKGDGTFEDISSSSGIGAVSFSDAVAVDYDNDGFTDIFGMRNYYGGYLCLLRNNRDNTFTNVIQDTRLPLIKYYKYNGTTPGHILFFDYDNDNDQDLLLSPYEMGMHIELYRNNGDGTFGDVTNESRINKSVGSATGIAVGDYNNDGYTDIFCTSFFNWEGMSNHNILYKNNGNGTFSDVTIEAGNIAMGSRGGRWGNAFFDYDNDGDLDLHITNSGAGTSEITTNLLYRNNGDGTFSYIADSAFPKEAMPSGSVAAIGDYNNDGALDIYAPGTMGTSGAFLKNLIGDKNNWIKIKLEGMISNKSAFGARVYLKTGATTQIREVHTSSVEAQPLHFGLGQEASIDEIEIHWPSGAIQELTNINPNQLIKIIEPSSSFPAITSFNPRLASIGDAVTITGSRFGSAQGSGFVNFSDGKRAIIQSWSDTEVFCTVPEGAVSGNVYVMTNNGKSNNVYFILSAIPNAPSNLTAICISYTGTTNIYLNWNDNSNNENGFKIERSLDGSTFTQIAAVGTDIETYNDTNANPDKTYYYRICAYDDNGDSLYSNIAQVPAMPSGLMAVVISLTQANLTWLDKSENETGFKITRVLGGSDSEALVPADTVAYSDTALLPDKMCWYQIYAYTETGRSALSNSALVYTGLPSAAPSNLRAVSNSATQITLRWTHRFPSGEIGFKIERSLDNTLFTQIATTPVQDGYAPFDEIYCDSGLDGATTYYYRMCSYNGIGDSDYSNTASATTLPPLPPIAPSSLIATAVSSSEINLKWKDNSSDETGFKIERSSDGNTFVRIATVSADVINYNDTGLSGDTKYYYRVCAYNAGGDSLYSDISEASTIEDKISIELNKASWVLEGVKLGERRTNMGGAGYPAHRIKNTGNVPVNVDIKYCLNAYPYPVKPGIGQDVDTFVTEVCEDGFNRPIPPNLKESLFIGYIEPGSVKSLGLIFGAPTKLTKEIKDMQVKYELRAYKKTE